MGAQMGKSRPVLGTDDLVMWESIARRSWSLQKCGNGHWRYPPAPICPECLSLQHEWQPIGGLGTILSWVVFHRRYFDDYHPPYNVIAVRLDEGPIVMSNLVGPEPEGNWIGRRVELVYEDHEGSTLPRMKLIP
jgi:uncharacterized OB-fold protein